MKVLMVTRGNLEIERVHLMKPVICMGRSPTNDVVLRAPGVAPLHFIIEWIGTGEFDATQNLWSVSDISKPSDAACEGVVLSGSKATFHGFSFHLLEDSLEAKPVIGGKIAERLTKDPTVYARAAYSNSVVEVVQIRSDSGAVEDVKHLPVQKGKKVYSVLKAYPQFKLQWDDNQLRIVLSEMPGAGVFNRGSRVNTAGQYQLGTTDVVLVQWRGVDFYVRFVPRIEVPAIKRDVIADPLLKKLTVIAAILFLLLFLLLTFTGGQKPQELIEAPRVATIEIVNQSAPPPPPPPPEEEPVAPVESAPPKSTKVEKTQAAPKQNAGGTASKPKYVGPKTNNVGLNSPAPVKNTNQVGVLGALGGGTGPKGPGVRADLVIKNGIQTEAVTGNTDSGVLVKNPPSGVIGKGAGGNPRGNGQLADASTSFGGSDTYDPGSTGPITRKGAKGKGFSVGDQLSGTGVGVRGGKGGGISDLGSPNDGRVEGGLDKETVRRVIKGHEGEIRTCYDRALISNPGVGGRITYRWNINPQGIVTAVNIQQSTAASPRLEGCVTGVIKGMVFPAAPNGKPTTVIYPFVFKAQM
jgi:hypothetical protein